MCPAILIHFALVSNHPIVRPHGSDLGAEAALVHSLSAVLEMNFVLLFELRNSSDSRNLK